MVGVIILDTVAQMMQVGNQTRVFGLSAEARSRTNTVYMTLYFTGGAIGSALASLAWARWQWNGVCALATAMVVAAGLWHALHGRGASGKGARSEADEAALSLPEEPFASAKG